MIYANNFYFFYNILYFLTAVVAVFVALYIDVKGYSNTTVKISNFFSVLLTITFVFLIGLRYKDVGTDTINYYNFSWDKDIQLVDIHSDFVFYYLIYFIKSIGLSYQHFLLTVSFLFFTIIYWGYKKISKYNNINLFLLLFSLFSFFFCQSLSINVMRQGLSLAFLLLAYVFYSQESNKKNIFVCLGLSVGFHLTALIPICLFILVNITKNIKLKFYYFVYILGLILAYMGYGVKSVSSFLGDILMDGHRVSYLSAEVDYYQTGFRVNFAAFNTIFLIIFGFLNRKYKNVKYELLLKYYILASFVFFMAFQIPFSDRWGLFSWIFIPILFSHVFSLNTKIKMLNTFSVLFLIFIYIFFNVLYK